MTVLMKVLHLQQNNLHKFICIWVTVELLIVCFCGLGVLDHNKRGVECVEK